MIDLPRIDTYFDDEHDDDDDDDVCEWDVVFENIDVVICGLLLFFALVTYA